MPSRPVSVLPGHRSGIVDMQCYDELEVLITCSRDAVCACRWNRAKLLLLSCRILKFGM